MLCWFLPYSKMNQPYVDIYKNIYLHHLPFELPSHSQHRSVLSRVLCATSEWVKWKSLSHVWLYET